MKIKIIDNAKTCESCRYGDFELGDFPCNKCDASSSEWRPEIGIKLPSEAEKRLSDERMKSYIAGFKAGWNSALEKVIEILNK